MVASIRRIVAGADRDRLGLRACPPRRGVLPSDPIVLDVKNLGKSFYSREGIFGKREFKAVKDVSFTLARGKTMGLVGESGSGKTTVGLTLMRLHEATTGEALFGFFRAAYSPP